jgi:ATP-dependent exoDNAse (exonuclease V) beta subunit
MLHMLWHAVERDFDSATEHAVAAASRSEAPVQRLRRLPVDWRAPQLAEVSATVLPRVVELEEEPIFDWVSQTSRHVGTLVHRELERLCGATPHVNLSGERARLRAELAELGVPADRTEAACDRVVEALRRMLEDERGRWLLGLSNQISDAESEVALSGVVGGQIVEGVIDRTFVDEHGTRWIVDFKTSTHEGGGLEAFLDEETTRYRPQLARYASVMQLFRPGQTVRAALYFPLLRQWREVDLN